MEYYEKTIKLVKFMLFFVIACLVFAYVVRPYMNKVMENEKNMKLLMQNGESQVQTQPDVETQQPVEPQMQEQPVMQVEQPPVQQMQPMMQVEQPPVEPIVEEQPQMPEEQPEEPQMQEQDLFTIAPDEEGYVRMSLDRLRQINPQMTQEEENAEAERLRQEYRSRMQ